MPIPKKTYTINRSRWRKTKDKNVRRKKHSNVMVGDTCKLCIYGKPPLNSNAKIKCGNPKADVTFDPGKKHWMCHSFEMDKRLS